jgi:hypothetical protein
MYVMMMMKRCLFGAVVPHYNAAFLSIVAVLSAVYTSCCLRGCVL